MKLSEYPILESPSAAALVPVIDDGANYTVLLNSLGGGGSSNAVVTVLNADASEFPLPNLKKNKFYRLLVSGAQSNTTNLFIKLAFAPNVGDYANRYTFSFTGGTVTGLDGGYAGLGIDGGPGNTAYLFDGLISTFGIAIVQGNCARTQDNGDDRPTHTHRSGRCYVPLSNLSGDDIAISCHTVTGVIKAGFKVVLEEI